jgi:hypothetical protein
MGRILPQDNGLRRTISTYLHVAGIEVGYGFFAPNVPESYKLVFELHFSDGRVEYEVAGPQSGESSFRFASLLDFMGRTTSEQERQGLVRLVAGSMWRKHPDLVKVRALLGAIVLPGPIEYRQGKSPAYVFRHAYEFAPPLENRR